MSAPSNGYSPRELMELASLDALGLLDREERESFETAFREAPASLQAQIRREQRRLTDADDWLPEVEPPSGLRDRVISAVRGAMATVRGEHDIAGRIGHGAWSMRANVSPLWRAACIGFAAATLVLLVSGAYLQRSYSQTVATFRDGKMAEQLATPGPNFAKLFLDRNTTFHSLTPVADVGPANAATARVMINIEFGQGLLTVQKLPVFDGEYRLELVDARGNRHELATFTTDGEIERVDFKAGAIQPGMELDIVQVAQGGRLVSPVMTKVFAESL